MQDVEQLREQIRTAIRTTASNKDDALIDGAIGASRIDGGTLKFALPILHEAFPAASIDELGRVGAAVWNITEDPAPIAAALTRCKAWDAPTIATASAAVVAQYHDVYVRKAADDQGALPYAGTTVTASWDIIPFGVQDAGNPPQDFGPAHWDQDFGVALAEGQQNRIYVRAVNAFPKKVGLHTAAQPCAPVQLDDPPRMELYWTRGSVALTVDRWSQNRLQSVSGCGWVDLLAAGGGNDLVGAEPFVWTPGDLDHYCLVARVVTPYHPNALPAQNDINGTLDWLRHRPGFAWRNVTIRDLSAEPIKALLHFRNHDPAPARFLFTIHLNQLAGAEVQLADAASNDFLIGHDGASVVVDSHAAILGASLTLPANYEGDLVVYAAPTQEVPTDARANVEVRFYALLTPDHPAFAHASDAVTLGLGDSMPMKQDEHAAMIGNYVFRFA